MPDIVIVAYRPKPGQEAALLALVEDHVPALRREGLATDRTPVIARAKDGTIVEVFEWATGAIEKAHTNPAVLAMWEKFGAACEYVRLKDLAEAGDLFAGFSPVSAEETE
jgi:quinol monooxygenase YgiN